MLFFLFKKSITRQVNKTYFDSSRKFVCGSIYIYVYVYMHVRVCVSEFVREGQ